MFEFQSTPQFPVQEEVPLPELNPRRIASHVQPAGQASLDDSRMTLIST